MLSFDSFPTSYWVPVYGLCWLLTWALLTNRLRSSQLYLGLSFLLLFLLRLPSIVYNQEINPDESQMLAQALTLRHDPVFWRSVDGTTGGPLNTYLLTVVGMFGFPYDYTTARLVAYGLVVLILWLSYRTARLWFDETPARYALLPFVFMLGLTQHGDLIHYNSELIVVALLTGSVYLYAIMVKEPKPRFWRIGLIGLLLGMVPFSKLQGLPSAAVIGLFVGFDLLTRPRLNTGNKYRRLAMLAGGGLTFIGVALALIVFCGVYWDFETFYIKANFGYGDNPSFLTQLLYLPAYLHLADEILFIVLLTTGIWLLSARPGSTLPAARRFDWRVGGLLLLLLAAGLYAALRTGMNFVHYLYFLFNPLLLLLAYGWQRLFARRRRWVPGVEMGAMALFLLFFGITTADAYRQGRPANPYPSDQQGGWQVPLSPVAKEVMKYAKSGEPLVVWGWMCSYYVETRMPQGVAENHSQRSVLFKPMLKQYQQRYLSDVLRSYPPVFVDAVGNHDLWLTDRQTQGHEIIKPLKRFIAAHYRYMGMVNDTRIYVRKDRINGPPAEKSSLALR